jgi:nucleoside-diphosphate-sugar epimerase
MITNYTDCVNVFGGSGFIGSRFVELNPDSVVNSRDDYEVKTKNVLYLISSVDVYNIFTDPYLDIDTNLTTLIKVLETCKNKDVTFNFVSSVYVYGNIESPMKETDYCHPNGFYGITKHTAEQMLIHYCETFNIKYRIIRLANVLGIGDKKVSKRKNVLQYMINQLKANEDITIFNENISRDYLHVDDVISAISLVLERGELNEIYNIGRGQPHRLIDIICLAKSALGSTSEIIITDNPTGLFMEKSYLDTTKLKSLGFVHKISIMSIIKELTET